MPQTIDAIVTLSKLPVSIIIVGVGNADFDKMEKLDGDDGVLKDSHGTPVQRDIVQFVEFVGCMRTGSLSQQVLREVPKQVVSYMLMSGIQPQAVPVSKTAYKK